MTIYKKILKVIKKINEDNIFIYSAQASFYIIISSIPFIMLLLSLTRYFFPVSEEDFSGFILPLIPNATKLLAKNIISELFYKSGNYVIPITVISTLWPASRGIAAIERGIKNVYHTPSHSNFIKNVLTGILYTVIFIVIIIFLLATSVFGASVISFFEADYGILHHIFSKTSYIKSIVTFFILTSFFAFMYMAFSGRTLSLKMHFPGAFFTTSAWMIFSALFSLYIENFSNYPYIYGSLTAIVLMMLWIYFCMIIFLLGGEINVAISQMQKNKN